MPYIGVSPQFGVRRKHTYTATAGQTIFTGAGSEGATLSYTDSNFVDVYQNGVKLGDADYTSTSGTQIVLTQAASVDDLVEIIVFDAFSIADTISKADGGTFDGNVTMAGTLAVTGETTLATHLNMGDNDKIKLGASGDLEIYHDTNHSYVEDTGTGELRLKTNGTAIRFQHGSETLSLYTEDGSVELYHDDSKKFETTSSGIIVNNKIQGASGESLTIESQSGGAVIFNSNGANERLRIASSGQVALNKNQTFGTYAFWLSDAKNSSSSTPCANSGITIANNDAQPSANDYHHGITFAGHYTAPNRTRVGIFFQSTADAHTGGAFIIATRGAADASELTFADQKVKIGSDGNFQATDTSISSLSDGRLKQNIENFQYDLEKFKKFQPKTFQWKNPEWHGGTVKEDGTTDQFTQRGFVAQDIEKIDTYWLNVDPMDSQHPEYELVKDDPNVKTSKLGKKDAMYVSVIQQLLTKIEALEDRITVLEKGE
tara:strand:+ start:4756 stop:6219 length:1464 start_codon:yes stop_codon:yes gene_type:complete